LEVKRWSIMQIFYHNALKIMGYFDFFR